MKVLRCCRWLLTKIRRSGFSRGNGFLYIWNHQKLGTLWIFEIGHSVAKIFQCLWIITREHFHNSRYYLYMSFAERYPMMYSLPLNLIFTSNLSLYSNICNSCHLLHICLGMFPSHRYVLRDKIKHNVYSRVNKGINCITMTLM